MEVTSGANSSLAHEVERHRFRQSIACIGVLDAQINNNLVKLVSTQDLHIKEDSLKFGLLFGLLFLGQDFLDMLFDQLISSPRISSFHVFDHKVRKLIHVPRHFKHVLQYDVSAVQLEHVLFQDEIVAPQVLHILFELLSQWAIIVETSTASVNIERGGVEELTFE